MRTTVLTRLVSCIPTLLGLFVLVAGVDARAQAVKVVNIIPLKYSMEEVDNAEPTLAVRPGTPTDLAVSVHLYDKRWCAGPSPFSGYFASDDGGDVWTLVCLHASQSARPYDPTLRFSGDGKSLYIAYLKLKNTQNLSLGLLYLQGNKDLKLPDGVFSIISPAASAKENYDQPQVMTFPGPSSKRVLIAAAGTTTASAEPTDECRVHVFVATQPTSEDEFSHNCVGTRKAYENPYAIRVATHQSGRVYIAYLHTRTDTDEFFWDVVVQSGLIGSTGSPKLDDLEEPDTDTSCKIGGGQLGMRVGKCIVLDTTGEPTKEFGWENPLGSELSLAVDPSDENRVYVAWGDRSSSTSGPFVTLHVRKSTDGGKTWSGSDLFTVANATNPALAVDSKGRLGFLYQQVVQSGVHYRWKTRLCVTTFCNASSMDATSLVLADTPAGNDKPDEIPFIGDYDGLVAVEDAFYGVFSARNDPTDASFPRGVTYQRRCSGGKLRNLANHEVVPSVDPFFFRVQMDLPAVPASPKPAC